MKNLAFLFIGALVLLTACHKPKTDTMENSWETIRSFNGSRSIDTVYIPEHKRISYFVANNGDKQVFSWEYSRVVPPNSNDYESGQSLYFQIDKDATSFEYHDAELKDNFTFYQEYGAWSGYPPTAVEHGTISGTKLSENTWQISIDITMPDDGAISRTQIKDNGIYHIAQ